MACVTNRVTSLIWASPFFSFSSGAGTAHTVSFCSCFVCSLVIDFYFEGLVETSTCTPAWLFFV